MNELFQVYFQIFKNSPRSTFKRQLSMMEVMGVSWFFNLIYASYSVLLLVLSVKSYSFFSKSNEFSYLAPEILNFKMQKISLFSILFVVVFYPITFYLGYKFWKMILNFYAHLFEFKVENFIGDEKGDSIESRALNVIQASFSSNLFLVLPIVGKWLSGMAMVYFLFRGVKENFYFSNLQAFLVLLTPLFLLFLFLIFSASYFVLLFSFI